MNINTLHQINFDTDETIVTATLCKPNELVALMSSGDVIRYQINEKTHQILFSVNRVMKYSDGGFDITAKSSIYTLDDIVVVVNDYKRHGFIHYPDKYQALHLWREDYHADISCYPIALFKNAQNVPHIIYSVAWNRLDIMNLDTLQVLTAAKSLIKENAEADHIKFYENYKNPNSLPWPSAYDYFFGQLLLSPDQKTFLSAGWGWGSADLYYAYDIENFINNNRITDIRTNNWEHENRAVCWIDHKTIAITYSPLINDEYFGDEDDEDNEAHQAIKASLQGQMYDEIHFYEINNSEQAKIVKRVQILGLDIVHSTLNFCPSINALIAFSAKIGLVVISLSGEIIFQDANLEVTAYQAEMDVLLNVEDKIITIYKLTTHLA